MKHLPFAAAALAAALSAQEMPQPKVEQHETLRVLAGTWEFVMKMAAMPGVPGMEEPVESKGIERAELILDGLWLKSVVHSTWKGTPFQGIWLAGYDPFAKQYKGYWVSSDEEECQLAVMDGSYDAKSRTWTWTGNSPHGPMRSTFALQGDDRSVETCFIKLPDGQEIQCMEVTRTRAKAATTAEASAKVQPRLGKEHQLLQQDVGDWDATIVMAIPGEERSADKATERIRATCNGRWLWSDFKGQFMGAPFAGHSLVGYDPTQGKYVSLWLDSMSAVAMLSSGTYDEAKKAFTLTGQGVDPDGKPLSVRQVLTWKDDDTRVLEMEFKGADDAQQMQITYRRKTKG